jgi:hypothetical protein
MNSHLKTAHQYGVDKALEECGYKSAEEVAKEANELGLFEEAQTEQTKTAEPQGGVFDVLRRKLS